MSIVTVEAALKWRDEQIQELQLEVQQLTAKLNEERDHLSVANLELLINERDQLQKRVDELEKQLATVRELRTLDQQWINGLDKEIAKWKNQAEVYRQETHRWKAALLAAEQQRDQLDKQGEK